MPCCESPSHAKALHSIHSMTWCNICQYLFANKSKMNAKTTNYWKQTEVFVCACKRAIFSPLMCLSVFCCSFCCFQYFHTSIMRHLVHFNRWSMWMRVFVGSSKRSISLTQNKFHVQHMKGKKIIVQRIYKINMISNLRTTMIKC